MIDLFVFLGGVSVGASLVTIILTTWFKSQLTVIKRDLEEVARRLRDL